MATFDGGVFDSEVFDSGTSSIRGDFSVDASITGFIAKAWISYGGAFEPDAFQHDTFVVGHVPPTFQVRAIIFGTSGAATTLDAAIVFRPVASLTADAIRLRPGRPGSPSTANAIIQRTFSPAGLKVDAERDLPWRPFTVDATLWKTINPSFTVGAEIVSVRDKRGLFTLDALIPTPYARVTQAPLEVLEQAGTWDRFARVTQAPLEVLEQADSSTRYARVTQVVLEVIHPRSNGWFTLDAYIFGPTLGSFSVDATRLKTATPTFTLNAAVVRRPTGSFTLDARIPPWKKIDAVLKRTMVPAIAPAPTGFYVAARKGYGGSWTINADLFKVITPTFSVSAMISSGHFTLDAYKDYGSPTIWVGQEGIEAARTGIPAIRVAQAGLEAVRSNPEALILVAQSGFEVAFKSSIPQAVVAQAGLEVARVTIPGIFVSVFGYERARTGGEPRIVAAQTGVEVARLGVPGALVTTMGVEVAYEKPKGEPRVDAIVFHPGMAGSFTVGADIVFTMYVNAVVMAEMPSSFSVRAVVVVNVTGSFTLDADVQLGFLVDSVLIADQRAVFTLFAYKVVVTTGTGSFSLDAYLSRSFEVSAWITKPRPFTVDAAIIEAGKYLKSFYADAAVASLGEGGEFTLEAEIWAQRTVVHEGAGSTQRSLVHHTERLSFPGTQATEDWANPNRLTGLFYPADTYPLTITVWEMPSPRGTSDGIGFASQDENQWYRPSDGAMSGQYPSMTPIAAGGFTFTAWPMYYQQRHYVYFWPDSNIYDPTIAGSGIASYYQWEDLTLALPAPTLDAWIVGTPGTPFTLDAEIVESEKTGLFYLDADLMKAGEKRSTFAVESHLLAPQAYFFVAQAELAALHFTLDALIHQPSFTLDAHIHLVGGADGFFTVNAALKKTMTWYPNGPKLDAVKVRPTRTGAYALDADIRVAGDKRGLIRLDSVLVGAREKRFYLAALIISDVHFTVDAFIGRRLTVDAWIGSIGGGMGSFSVGAYIRGSSIIVFPDDGGPPTDPTGGPPPISRKFRVKIEAFIPDPIPVGNDQEIENLIMKILEAEAELESLYCAVEHYSSQGYPVAGGRNSYGGGYTGSLPSAISQIGYPGAGDIDDCWVVATVWAAIASGQTFTPTVPQFRAWAQNPDRPGATGGTLDHIMRGARGAWPGATIRRYASSDWNGFISLLKAGWTASLAVRSSALPSNLRYGFNGLHQIGVAYQNGSYVIMNPLQSTGSSLHAIDGYDLRTAARGFTGGTICACMFR